MTFEEILTEAIALLRRQRRVSYRALQRQFGVDESFIDDLKVEIVEVLELAADQDGKFLVWRGNHTPAETTAHTTSASTETQTPATIPRATAERRQLTVMFCDLVDSTALSAALDPEDLRNVVRECQRVVTSVAERFGGHVAQYLGDGVLIYFGYPVAHEDDARRAVSSALEIIAGLQRLNSDVLAGHRVRVAMRVGVHTGPVVVGEIGSGSRHEQLAMGETPNIAARVQSLASPNSVLITSSVRRLIEGFFTTESLGPQTMKGIPEAVAVHRVVGETDATSRLETVGLGELTPLVGRDSEVRLLRERWDGAVDGRGSAVILSGEAGIGKSRLVGAVQDHALSFRGGSISFRCSAYHLNSAFHPIIDRIGRMLELQREDSAEARLVKLETGLASYTFANERTMGLIAGLLSIPVPEGRYPAQTLSAQQQKQRTLETLVSWLLEEAERQPLLVVWEDLHWADPSTLELITMLVDQLPTSAILAVLTCRPEFSQPWTNRTFVAQLALNRLSGQDAQAMVHQMVHSAALPPEVLREVIAKTDGVPLFIEELLKMVLESGLLVEENGRYELRGPLPPLAIPATLQDSLMARLDRLSSSRSIAQVGAAIGREFSQEMIEAVSPLDRSELEEGLGQLVTGELVYRRGRPPNATYVFKHALIRDAAYQSLLKSERARYHQRIAEVLLERYPDTVMAEPELLAHHYAEAGLAEQAIAYWQRAAQRAVQRSANSEAIAYLTHALEMVELLPAGVDRARHELEIRVTLGVPLIMTRGYGNVDVERTYARARELAFSVSDTPQLPNILWGMWVFYLCGGPMLSALEMAEQYRASAELHPDDTSLALETCQLMGIAHFYRGEFFTALPFLEKGSALYDPAAHHRLVFEHGGADTGVAIRTHLGLTLWALGAVDRARGAMDEALVLARQVNHPFSLAFAQYFCAWFHKLCREEDAVVESSTAAIEICDQYDFPFWGFSSAALRGSSVAELGEVDRGISENREKLTAFEATGGLLHRSPLRGLLATAYHRAGRHEDALREVAEAIAAIDGRDERWWEPELHRLHGEFLLAVGKDREAEEAFRRALDIARSQRARSWELRAAVSLAILEMKRGRGDHARELVSAAYGAMTEGFETRDLREAQALIG
jgi:class 3 adenylate cyclase/predicted ATPase